MPCIVNLLFWLVSVSFFAMAQKWIWNRVPKWVNTTNAYIKWMIFSGKIIRRKLWKLRELKMVTRDGKTHCDGWMCAMGSSVSWLSWRHWQYPYFHTLTAKLNYTNNTHISELSNKYKWGEWYGSNYTTTKWYT